MGLTRLKVGDPLLVSRHLGIGRVTYTLSKMANIMTYNAISLTNLMNQKNHEMFLPHIQRAFVWSEDQVVRFWCGPL